MSRPNSYGDNWVVGDWATTGANDRGSLTLRDRDANPEAIIVGDPLDGTDNPDNVKLGDALEDSTGVVMYAFSFYYVLPLTSIRVTGEPAYVHVCHQHAAAGPYIRESQAGAAAEGTAVRARACQLVGV